MGVLSELEQKRREGSNQASKAISTGRERRNVYPGQEPVSSVGWCEHARPCDSPTAQRAKLNSLGFGQRTAGRKRSSTVYREVVSGLWWGCAQFGVATERNAPKSTCRRTFRERSISTVRDRCGPFVATLPNTGSVHRTAVNSRTVVLCCNGPFVPLVQTRP